MSDSITVSKLSGFGRGKDSTFDKSQISLGTDASNDVRFDPTWDKTVSSRHANIEKRSDGWWIIDQSRDGCWVDGQRVQQAKLGPGTVVELGKGGPRVKIDYGSAKPVPDRVSDAFQRQCGDLACCAIEHAQTGSRRGKNDFDTRARSNGRVATGRRHGCRDFSFFHYRVGDHERVAF